MATRESIHHMLDGASHFILAAVGALPDDPGSAALRKELYAALPQIAKVQRALRELHPDVRSGPFSLAEQAAAHQQLTDHRDRALAAEHAGDLARAMQILDDYLALPSPSTHHVLAELERWRLSNAQLDDTLPDGPPSTDEQAVIDALTPTEIDEIDRALLAAAKPRWQKVGMLVGTALCQLAPRIAVCDLYYAQRVARFVETGQLEATGDLGRMRYSEVRLPDTTAA